MYACDWMIVSLFVMTSGLRNRRAQQQWHGASKHGVRRNLLAQSSHSHWCSNLRTINSNRGLGFSETYGIEANDADQSLIRIVVRRIELKRGAMPGSMVYSQEEKQYPGAAALGKLVDKTEE